MPLLSLLPAVLPPIWAGVVNALATRLLGQPLTASDLAAVLTFIQKAAGDLVLPTSSWLGWQLPYLVGILLDLPYHGLR